MPRTGQFFALQAMFIVPLAQLYLTFIGIYQMEGASLSWLGLLQRVLANGTAIAVLILAVTACRSGIKRFWLAAVLMFVLFAQYFATIANAIYNQSGWNGSVATYAISAAFMIYIVAFYRSLRSWHQHS
jgi:hypothetical protein